MDPTKSFVKGVEVTVVFFGREGQPISRLTSQEGWWSWETNDMQARGHVVVRSTTGALLETEWLAWQQDRETIQTDAPVKVMQPQGNVIMGVGMVSNLGLDRVTIRQVDAVVTDPEAFRQEFHQFK